jgi:hypothetical protein
VRLGVTDSSESPLAKELGSDPNRTGPLLSDLITSLRREGDLLISAAAGAGLEAEVPTCPGWRVRDLVHHTGVTHRWAAAHIREGRRDQLDPGETEALSSPRPADDLLLEWYRAANREVAGALERASPQLAGPSFPLLRPGSSGHAARLMRPRSTGSTPKLPVAASHRCRQGWLSTASMRCSSASPRDRGGSPLMNLDGCLWPPSTPGRSGRSRSDQAVSGRSGAEIPRATAASWTLPPTSSYCSGIGGQAMAPRSVATAT